MVLVALLGGVECRHLLEEGIITLLGSDGLAMCDIGNLRILEVCNDFEKVLIAGSGRAMV